MTNRSPVIVLLLSLITGGIYSLFWLYWTKEEMRRKGNNDIPTFWLIWIPFAGLYWLWKWSEGVEKVTNGAMSGAAAFVLTWLLGPIGDAIVQGKLNEVADPTPVAAA